MCSRIFGGCSMQPVLAHKPYRFAEMQVAHQHVGMVMWNQPSLQGGGCRTLLHPNVVFAMFVTWISLQIHSCKMPNNREVSHLRELFSCSLSLCSFQVHHENVHEKSWRLMIYLSKDLNFHFVLCMWLRNYSVASRYQSPGPVCGHSIWCRIRTIIYILLHHVLLSEYVH